MYANLPGTPAIYHWGTKDESPVEVKRDPVPRPQHCPKIMSLASWGPQGSRLVNGADLINLYGKRTFEVRSPFYTHQTVFAQGCIEEGNALVFTRLIPQDAPPPASLRLSLEVLETTVDIYAREEDGFFSINPNTGAKTVTGSAPGFKVRWRVAAIPFVDGDTNFGGASIQNGTWTENGATSKIYPIRDFMVPYVGSPGNDIGLRIWAPLASKNSLAHLLTNERVYPYAFAVVTRKTPKAMPTLENSLMGQPFVMASFKEAAYDETTSKEVGFDKVFLNAYRNTTDLRFKDTERFFGNSYGYDNYVELVLQKFHQAEADFIDPDFYDFTDSEDDLHLFNFVSGQNSNGVPYQTFQFDTGGNAVRLGEHTNLMCSGGGDGTLTDEMFETLVQGEMARYLDEYDPIQDVIDNPESDIYDSGFSLPTKLSLLNAIALRKDINVAVGSYIANGPVLSPSDQLAMATTLMTTANLMPESEYFGTPVCRAQFVGACAQVSNSPYTKFLPLTYHLMKKRAKQRGASHGRWKPNRRFSYSPGSIIDDMFNVQAPWLAVPVRTKLWDVGLNWPQKVDREAIGFPGIKTVYNEPTSVLNNESVSAVLGECTKVLEEVMRGLQGVDDLTDLELETEANRRFVDRTKGRFDGLFNVVPEAVVTVRDAERGDSLTMPVVVYAENARRVMSTYLIARRKSAITAVTGE